MKKSLKKEEIDDTPLEFDISSIKKTSTKKTSTKKKRITFATDASKA